MDGAKVRQIKAPLRNAFRRAFNNKAALDLVQLVLVGYAELVSKNGGPRIQVTGVRAHSAAKDCACARI